MYTYQIKTYSDNQVDIEINIPKKTIENFYEQSFENLRKELVVEGFRKGTVPKKIAEKKISKEKVYENLIQNLLPKIYLEVLKKENLKSIIEPQIDFKKAKENEDWQVIIKIAIKPKVNLKNFKKMISDHNKKNKKSDIWVPGKKVEQTGSQDENEEQKIKKIDAIFEILLKEAECIIPNILINQELNRKLSSLIDELQKVGLTIDSYLKSKNLTIETLKERYKKEITEAYKLEFILQEIADKENITVEIKEIENLLQNIKKEKDRQLAEENRYLYAALLRKQKTIDFLLNL